MADKTAPFELPAGLRWPTQTDTIMDLVGNTPMHRLQRLIQPRRENVEIWAKVEGMNPGGSIKDRPATMMIVHALATGKLRPGKVILDSTSGNTGVALAMIGASLGYSVSLTMSAGASLEKRPILYSYGANLVLTDPARGSDGAILKAKEIYESDPDRYFVPDQYNNPANVWSHYLSTAPEIWKQTGGRITHLVASIGTGGTVMGTGRWLREHAPHVQIIAVEPDEAQHGMNGMRHIPSTIRPGIYREDGFDRLIRISTGPAQELVRQLARQEGLLVGVTAAAVLAAARIVAQELDHGLVVAICPDRGDRYAAASLYQAASAAL
jgi:S-sulfo-L-cysteine synthase (O-acetyl-L-serine-dependent)